MKRVSTILGMIMLTVLLSAAIQAKPKADATDSSDATMNTEQDSIDGQSLDKVVAYYFHSNRRCATCMKLEEYTAEVITREFADLIEQGLLEWQVVNFESEGNEHIVKDYKLITQSVILSRIVNGEETDWENLDKIWALVGDKEDFIIYIKARTELFIDGPEK